MVSTYGGDICVGGNEDTWLIRVLDVVVLMVVSLRVRVCVGQEDLRLLHT